MKRLVRDLAGPAVLIAAAVGAWFASAQLGDLSVEAASAPAEPTGKLATPLASSARVPALVSGAADSPALRAALDRLPPLPASLACRTIVLDGHVIEQTGTDGQLMPGLAQTVLTGHAALDRLGPDYRFETRVMAEARPDDAGALPGDLYLIGGGDPVLMSRSHTLRSQPIRSTATLIEDLADELIEAGITQIDGRILGSERRYDSIRGLPGTGFDDVGTGVLGPLSALRLNDGPRGLPADAEGTPAEPAWFAADQLGEHVAAQGVPIAAPAAAEDPSTEQPSLVPIASVVSPPLSDIVFQMWAVNDAGVAEMLMKELGFKFGQAGTTEAGGDVVQAVFVEAGVAMAVSPRDGSGIHEGAASSCALLAQAVGSIPPGHPSLEALPRFDLPGVHAGALDAVAIAADLRVVGGSVGGLGSMVATTADEGHRLIIVSVINRPGVPAGDPTASAADHAADAEYHRALLGAVDELQALAFADDAISADE